MACFAERRSEDSGIIMDMDKSEKKKRGVEEGEKGLGDESVFKQRVFKLTQGGDAGGLEELHEKGGWPDVEMEVYIAKGVSGNVWHYSALAMAAFHNQLEVVFVLIKMGVKVNEGREWYGLPSVEAAANGRLEVLELLVKNLA